MWCVYNKQANTLGDDDYGLTLSNRRLQDIAMLAFAFVKERVHNAVEIDIFGIFGRVFIDINLPPPPPPQNYSFRRPRFDAYTRVKTENSSIVQIEIVQIESDEFR